MVFFEMLFSEYLPLALTFVYGGILSVKTKFFQLRYLPLSIKDFFCSNPGKENDVSSFGAVCTTLASTIGTGNIVGVATAVSIGGVGAVFWMVVAAFFGMIIKSFEIVLCVVYKGERKGPFSYISSAFCGNKFMIFIFGLATVFSSFAGGNITQVNTIAFAFSEKMNYRICIGVLVGISVFIILSGGAKKVFKFSEATVPIMSAIYILLCLILIVVNYDKILSVVYSIFVGAFKPSAVTGGAVGSILTTIGIGVSRGVFSNEAGIGTAAFAHSDASKDAVKEGLFGVFEVFFDTVVMCSITGIAICVSGVSINYGEIASSQIINNIFFGVFGPISKTLISVMISIFGLTSTVGWGYFGISAIEEIIPKLKKVYIVVYSFVCVVGAVCSVQYAWRMAALFNGIMMCINMCAVIILSKKVIMKINLSKIR